MKHLDVSTFIAVLQRTTMMKTDPIAGRNIQRWEQGYSDACFYHDEVNNLKVCNIIRVIES